jgi:ornithine carbamoyltransferase
MKRLLAIAELTRQEAAQLFDLAGRLQKGFLPNLSGRTAIYSFEGNSLRTRATFLKALAHLRMTAIELPNLLKTREEKRHLAGYLDQWADLYIVREGSHEAIETFARASERPVINAMSAQGHPCEVLGDAYWLWRRFGSLQGLRFCLVGPPTNVLRSWVEMCELFALDYIQATPPGYAPSDAEHVTASLNEALRGADVVLTDGWPAGFDDPAYRVTAARLKLATKGAILIPCPPFNAAQEVTADAIDSAHFAGYGQKAGLYWMHMAIVAALLGQHQE